jgi:penicillin-binding protein activator
MRILFRLLGIFAILLTAAGCASSVRTVERTAADTITDLSGRWNDTDARLTAESMIQDLLSRPWLNRFLRSDGRVPVVVVGEVRNLSAEHIDTNPFISDMERELINSGDVRFVAGDAIRNAIRSERLDQQTQASEETIARLGEEIGADFMLVGRIGSIEDAAQGKKAVVYKITLELISIETNEKVWIGDKEIKKIIEQRNTIW